MGGRKKGKAKQILRNTNPKIENDDVPEWLHCLNIWVSRTLDFKGSLPTTPPTLHFRYPWSRLITQWEISQASPKLRPKQ